MPLIVCEDCGCPMPVENPTADTITAPEVNANGKPKKSIAARIAFCFIFFLIFLIAVMGMAEGLPGAMWVVLILAAIITIVSVIPAIRKADAAANMSKEERKAHRGATLSAINEAGPTTKRGRIRQNKKDGVACCPKCGSTSLSAHKKGFGIGKAVAGTLIPGAGAFGLMAGNIGAKKVRVTCLNCGKQFWAGGK